MKFFLTNSHIINDKYFDSLNELNLLLNDEQEAKVIIN